MARYCSQATIYGLFLLLVNTKAQFSVSLDEITPTSVRVLVNPQPGFTFDYKARIQGHEMDLKCDMKAATSERTCNIENLVPSTTYTVVVLGCTPGTEACIEFAKKWFSSSNMPKVSVSLDEIMETSVRVNVPPPAGTEGKYDYKAQVKGQEPTLNCEIKADSGASTCQLQNLVAGIQYALEVISCLKGTQSCENVYNGLLRTPVGEKASIVVDAITTSSVQIKVNPAPGTTSKYDYKAQITGQETALNCEIKADSTIWTCSIGNLVAATQYNVVVLACLKDSTNCEKMVDWAFTTLTESKYRIVPESITPNSVTARMIPKPGTAVTLPYAARIKGGTAEQICLIPPAATVLQCKIEGLKACTEYTLELLPCDPAAGPCDSVDEKTFTTDAAPCQIEIALSEITEDGVTVEVKPSTVTVETTYTATIKSGTPSQTCEIQSGSAVKQCRIVELQPATPYTVVVVPCDKATSKCEMDFTTDTAPLPTTTAKTTTTTTTTSWAVHATMCTVEIVLSTIFFVINA